MYFTRESENATECVNCVSIMVDCLGPEIVQRSARELGFATTYYWNYIIYMNGNSARLGKPCSHTGL